MEFNYNIRTKNKAKYFVSKLEIILKNQDKITLDLNGYECIAVYKTYDSGVLKYYPQDKNLKIIRYEDCNGCEQSITDDFINNFWKNLSKNYSCCRLIMYPSEDNEDVDFFKEDESGYGTGLLDFFPEGDTIEEFPISFFVTFLGE